MMCEVEEKFQINNWTKCLLNSKTKVRCVNAIQIEQGSIFSWDVKILDSGFHSIDGKRPGKPLIIDENVWVKVGATILKGAEIGDGCVVAAGTVCSGKLPPNSLIAGVPGRVKKGK